jgi:hypothetical protein
MQRSKDIPGISCGLVNDNNIFEWEVMLMINDDCKYYGGEFLTQYLPDYHHPLNTPPFFLPHYLYPQGRDQTPLSTFLLTKNYYKKQEAIFEPTSTSPATTRSALPR